LGLDDLVAVEVEDVFLLLARIVVFLIFLV